MVGGGAVPVFLVGRAGHAFAGVGFDDGSVAGADEGNVGDDLQGLAKYVGVPVGAGAGGEVDVVEASVRRFFAGVDDVPPSVTGEKPSGGLGAGLLIEKFMWVDLSLLLRVVCG